MKLSKRFLLLTNSALPYEDRNKSTMLIKKLLLSVFTMLPKEVKVNLIPLRYELEEKRLMIDDIIINLFTMSHAMDYGRDIGIDKEGHYELAMGKKFIETLYKVKERHFIDIGGAAGYYSILASQITFPDNIHSFEPNEIQYALLELNNRKYCKKRMTVNRKYVSDKTEKRHTTIDAYCNRKGLSPGLIKMDIEGWEYSAIQGMWNTLEVHRPYILIEFHEKKLRELFNINADKAKAILQRIADFGYRLEYNGHNNSKHLIEGVPELEWEATPPNGTRYTVFCKPT